MASIDRDRDVTTNDVNRTKDSNPDLITSAPGSHPVGTGIGAAAGGAGAAAAGAAIGAAVSGPAAPIGGVVGAVVGAVVGGYAGKAAAEAVDPTAEDAYWRENYRNRPYYDKNSTYEDYSSAYRYGVTSSQQYPGKRFDDVSSDLERGWEKTKGTSRLGWEKAKNATRDAWDRVESGMHRAGQKVENATDRMTGRASDMGQSTTSGTDRTNPDTVRDSRPSMGDESVADASYDRSDATGRSIRQATEGA
jgi:hypothetical protein